MYINSLHVHTHHDSYIKKNPNNFQKNPMKLCHSWIRRTRFAVKRTSMTPARGRNKVNRRTRKTE